MFSFSRLEHFADLQQRLRLLQEMDYIKLEDATASAPDGSAGGAAAAAAALDLSSEAQDLDVRSSSGYVLDIKGRVAAEITMTNEVLFTELLFGSIFGPLTPPECIALMSMFVGRLRKYERVSLTAVVIEDEAEHVANMEAATAAAHSSSASGGAAAAAAETPDGLLGVLPAGGGGAAASSVSASPRGGVPPSTVLRTTRRLQEAVRIVLDTAAAVEQKQHQLHIDALHAVLLPENVDFFYCWAMGDPVRQLFQLTRVLEGEAVRLALRLDEFCRQIINCARIMGNADLVAKMEMASRAVRRQLTDSCSIIATRDILD
ncbi:MAG: hypothetical protein EOO41_04015 [Methanobacteriota archaeon]|nr:MAG: hypothetical protein EOO41_04015 [Euryarchaeota archaeon]